MSRYTRQQPIHDAMGANVTASRITFSNVIHAVQRTTYNVHREESSEKCVHLLFLAGESVRSSAQAQPLRI